jgi:hypothetical protein
MLQTETLAKGMTVLYNVKNGNPGQEYIMLQTETLAQGRNVNCTVGCYKQNPWLWAGMLNGTPG